MDEGGKEKFMLDLSNWILWEFSTTCQVSDVVF